MTETALRRAKRPASPIAGPYGHPFHAFLVTIPIGSWIAAVLFDVVAFAGDDPEAFTIGARWLYGIGILGALLAAVLGFLDYSRLTAGTKAKRIATLHMALNLGAVVIFGIAWLLHLGSDEPTVGGLVLGIVGLLGLGVSGFLGGELVFRHGVRVADESDQAPGHEPTK
jgi:Predicted membrane protein